MWDKVVVTTCASAFALVLCWPHGAAACSPVQKGAIMQREAISGDEAASGFLAIGVVSASASVTLGTVLDETGRFPTLIAALTSLPAPVSTVALVPGIYPATDCPLSSMSVRTFSLRALVPLSLGLVPSVVSWWASESSTVAPVIVSAQLGHQTVGLHLMAHL